MANYNLEVKISKVRRGLQNTNISPENLRNKDSHGKKQLKSFS